MVTAHCSPAFDARAGIEGWGAMSGNHLVALLVPVVLCDVVEVIPTDCDGVGHLASRLDNPLQNLSANRHVAGEWALLVNVLSLNGGLGGFVAQADVLDVPSALAASAAQLAALDRSHVRLLLVSFLVLDVHG